MTTESTTTPDPGMRVLGGATVAGLAVSTVVTLLAAVTSGGAAVGGAAVGGFALTLVMAYGTFVVHVAAKAVPHLSLLVAIMTYALQIASMIAFFLVLDRVGAMGESVDGTWMVAGVVVASLTWSTVQIWLSAKARIPLYDLPLAGSSQSREASE